MWSGVAKLLERQQKGGTGKSVNACQGSPQADRDYVARTHAIDFQGLSGSGGVAGRGELGRARVQDCALSLPVARERDKRGRRRQYERMIDFGAGGEWTTGDQDRAVGEQSRGVQNPDGSHVAGR